MPLLWWIHQRKGWASSILPSEYWAFLHSNVGSLHTLLYAFLLWLVWIHFHQGILTECQQDPSNTRSSLKCGIWWFSTRETWPLSSSHLVDIQNVVENRWCFYTKVKRNIFQIPVSCLVQAVWWVCLIGWRFDATLAPWSLILIAVWWVLAPWSAWWDLCANHTPTAWQSIFLSSLRCLAGPESLWNYC